MFRTKYYGPIMELAVEIKNTKGINEFNSAYVLPI